MEGLVIVGGGLYLSFWLGLPLIPVCVEIAEIDQEGKSSPDRVLLTFRTWTERRLCVPVALGF